MRNIHRILGILLGILFFVWFASGLVMVYHTFPKISPNDRLLRSDILVASEMPAIDSIIAKNPKLASGRSLSMSQYMGQLTFSSGRDQMAADPNQKQPEITSEYIHAVAKLWCNAEIAKIDTLNKVDQWIPFGYYDVYFPIYKFHFADEQKHQLYIASTNGNVLQYTDKKSRFWAWMGAIPHWVYFTVLRQNASLWVEVVIWLAAIGCIMCVSGFIMSLYVSIKTKRLIPYKKPRFKWHQILGLSFGLISIAFAFSGLMSLADLSSLTPQPTMEKNPMQIISKKVNVVDYPLDYRSVLAQYPDTRQIEWASFAGDPYYVVRNATDVRYISATEATPKPISLTKERCEEVVRQIHGNNAELATSYLTEPDTYYIGRKEQVSLPVWRIEVVEDADRSTYYFNPESAQVRYVNRTARWRHWLYPALHSLRITWLVKHPVLWSIVMWLCMFGGAALSLTGVWLSIKYLLRKIRR